MQMVSLKIQTKAFAIRIIQINERGRTGDLDRDADECRGIFETGWEPE